MTFEQNMRTFTGCSISAMALTLTGLGVDALGVNCSLGPKELEPVIEELVKWTNLPIVVKPNAGLPDPETNLYNVTAAQFADFMKDLRKYGIKIFGGCCGTNPEFIKELSEMLKREGNPAAPHKYIPGAVCSATSTVAVSYTHLTQFAIYRSYGTHRHSSKRTPPHEQIYKYIAKLAKPELIFTIDYICTRNKMQLLL